MNALDRIIGKLGCPPPIPAEAIPRTLFTKLPGVQAAMELAWRQMSLTMLAIGFAAGLSTAAIVFCAVLFRANVRDLLRKILANGL